MSAEQQRHALERRAVRPDRPFVFGAGLTGTGQSSLGVALEMLGFVTRQWLDSCGYSAAGFVFEGKRDLIDNIRAGGYTAWIDWPAFVMEDLRQAYPGSLWIMTTRDTDEWWPSAAQRWAREYVQTDHRKLAFHGCAQLEARRRLYGRMFPNRSRAIRGYERHVERVRAMEAAGERVCWVDVAEENKWDVLCEFLNLPKPLLPYPRVNVRDDARRGQSPAFTLLTDE